MDVGGLSLATSAPHNAISVDECEVRFGDGVALPATSFAVDAGKCVALMGPSGSGKTTLFGVLRGDIRPTTGSAALLGQQLWSSAPRQRAAFRRQHVAQVFQNPMLLPELNVLENVALPAMLAGSSKADADASAMDRLADVGLDRFAHDALTDRSGGELQRIAVARALVRPVAVVLADEPTASLDSANALSVGSLLIRLARDNGAALLLATHDERVADLCDRTLRLL